MTTGQLINSLVFGAGLVALVAWVVIALRSYLAAHAATNRSNRSGDSKSNSPVVRPRVPPSESAPALDLSGLTPTAASSPSEPESITQISLLLADVIGEAQTSGRPVPTPLRKSAPVSEPDLFERDSTESRVTLIYEADAEEDEPTAPFARIVVAARGDSD